MSSPIVALTGATGYIGRFVTAALHEQGIAVRALSRPGSDRSGFAMPVEWIDGDLSETAALRRLTEGAEGVVHMAYAHVPGRYRGGEGADLPGWLAANVQGSLNLLLAARDAGVSRFVFLSSRAVFSRTEPGRVLDEAHPTSPDTHYGAYKVAVEAFLHSFRAVYGMQTFTVRTTGVYGVTWPVEQSKWWTLVTDTLAGIPVEKAGGGTEVYGGDVARVVYTLLTRPTVRAEVFHLSDLFISHRDVVSGVQRLTGCSGPLPPSSPLPANPLATSQLQGLGLSLGGQPRFEQTLGELVQLASAKLRLP